MTDARTITIALETPDQSAVLPLLEANNDYMAALYPAESNHGLSLADLMKPAVSFYVARLDGVAVGCGAVVAKDGFAELKRIYVSDVARGLKIGKRILAVLEDRAQALGLSRICLETGISQPEALGLYKKAGYVETEPFGGYEPDPLSIFMEKTV